MYFCGSKHFINMKRLTLLTMLILAFLGLSAQNAWTIKTVPNTRLESNDIHVSDPDGYLSDSAEMRINTALCAIREQADVFVVTLSSIGDDEPKRFATQLFNYWGIGDAATNNGVLLLFVEDQRALEFETGYGAEKTMTDATCQQIFTKTIVPYFRAGDYEGGLCAGVGEIVSVYGGTVPLGLVSTLPQNISDGSSSSDDDFSIFFVLFALFIFSMPFLGLYYWLRKRKKKTDALKDSFKTNDEQGVTYINDFSTGWSGSPWEGKGCSGGLMLGFSIFVFLFIAVMIITVRFPNLEDGSSLNWVGALTLLMYLTWVCFRQNHRALKTAASLAKTSINPMMVYKAAYNNFGNKMSRLMAPWIGWIYSRIFKKKMNQDEECRCPNCGNAMSRYAGLVLPKTHETEERIEALKFTPFRCYNGHVVVLKERGKQYNRFKTCSNCGAYALNRTQTETIREASYSRSGERNETYVCQHCGDTTTKTVTIPKLVYTSSSSSSSSSSYSSSSSSGGSFGGGRSGGGGYSGRW